MNSCGIRSVRSLWIIILAVVGLTGVNTVRADFAQDLARIHTEAIGGKARLQELKTLRATGFTRIQGKELHFVMWAERPNHIRTETTSAGRVLTEGYDGVNHPWLLDSKTGKVIEMGTEAAREFSADADFDDPLVTIGTHTVCLDYAGETEIDGRPVFKVLVTQDFTESSFIYLDNETYFIIRRDVTRARGGVSETIETYYSDFRAINGIILPHRIIEKTAGRLRHETVMETIEANPAIMLGFFARPNATVKP